MSETVLRCRVRKSGEGFEGTVHVPGLKPTKLVKKDETSVYSTQKSLVASARNLATRLNATLEVES